MFLYQIVAAMAYFRLLGGVVALLILEGALLTVDFLVPNEDDAAGNVIR
jgi:hypothetical protein